MESCTSAQNVTPLLPLDLIAAAMQCWPALSDCPAPLYLSTFHCVAFFHSPVPLLLAVFFLFCISGSLRDFSVCFLYVCGHQKDSVNLSVSVWLSLVQVHTLFWFLAASQQSMDRSSPPPLLPLHLCVAPQTETVFLAYLHRAPCLNTKAEQRRSRNWA